MGILGGCLMGGGPGSNGGCLRPQFPHVEDGNPRTRGYGDPLMGSWNEGVGGFSSGVVSWQQSLKAMSGVQVSKGEELD